MPKLKHGTILPTHEYDAAITSAAMSDPDALPYTDTGWEKVKSLVRTGRPKAEITKERITIRLSRDVVTQFRSTGEGWQTRMDSALRQYVLEHPLAIHPEKNTFHNLTVETLIKTPCWFTKKCQM
jgi:uncharacterized protein (DUF4415 family)